MLGSLVLTVLLLFFVMGVAVYEAKKDVFSPIVMAMFMIALFYICDALYLFYDSIYNDGFWLSGLYFSYEEEYFVSVTSVLYLSFLGWFLGDVAGKVISFRSLGEMRRGWCGQYLYTPKAGYYLIVFLVVSVGLMLVYQIQRVVGFSVYMSDMASRSMVFESFTMQNALLHIVVISSGFVSSHLYLVENKKASSIALLILSIVVAFSTGGRAIVLMLLVIWLLQYGYYVNKINLQMRHFIILTVFVVCLPFVALLTRTSSEFYEGEILANIFNTGQIPQANNIYLIAQNDLDGSLRGSSLWNDMFSFIPSFFFNLLGLEKKLGGNTDFTILFWPDRWDAYKSQISIGGIGEVFLNFSFVGVFLFYFLLGGVYRFLYSNLPLTLPNGIGFMFLVPLFWSIFQQFRGDYFHTVNKLFLFVSAILLVSFFIMRKCQDGKANHNHRNV